MNMDVTIEGTNCKKIVIAHNCKIETVTPALDERSVSNQETNWA
jgi:hypothetical protein